MKLRICIRLGRKQRLRRGYCGRWGCAKWEALYFLWCFKLWRCPKTPAPLSGLHPRVPGLATLRRGSCFLCSVSFKQPNEERKKSNHEESPRWKYARVRTESLRGSGRKQLRDSNIMEEKRSCLKIRKKE